MSTRLPTGMWSPLFTPNFTPMSTSIFTPMHHVYNTENCHNYCHVYNTENCHNFNYIVQICLQVCLHYFLSKKSYPFLLPSLHLCLWLILRPPIHKRLHTYLNVYKQVYISSWTFLHTCKLTYWHPYLQP